MRALVTGATGMIGPALVNQLITNGCRVKIFSRRSFDAAMFDASIESCPGDITDMPSIRRAVESVDVVFHLAAKLHINDPSPDQADQYQRINVDGAINVARAACEANVGRMVHFSTINVYGPSQVGSPPYFENSSLNPKSFYAASKIRSEEGILKTFGEYGRSSAVILRIAAVYGPRLQGNYRTLVKALKKGLFWPVGNGQNRRTMIYIDDLVRAAILAAEHPRAGGRIFNVTDGKIHTLDEVLLAISRAAGRTPKKIHLPRGPIQRFSDIGDQITKTMHLPVPSLRKIVDKLLEDTAVSGDKFCRELCFQPRFDLWQGWQAALRPNS